MAFGCCMDIGFVRNGEMQKKSQLSFWRSLH